MVPSQNTAVYYHQKIGLMSFQESKPKLLVILGPTATGKSLLAVSIAEHYNGEIISADSRQIYTGLDVGTGKVTSKETRRILHHLLDVANPNDYFSVTDFVNYAARAIQETITKNKLPLLVGGTGQYIQSVIDGISPPEVPPNHSLRVSLEKKSPEELLDQLKQLDPKRAETIEQQNPRRLIRAIEIATALGSVPSLDITFPSDYARSAYDVLQIGLQLSEQELQTNIKQRVTQRLHDGFVKEVFQLHKTGVSFERLKEIGLGYAIIGSLLEEDISQNIPKLDAGVLEEKITTAEWRYAKRQTRWFKRDARIEWFDPHDTERVLKRVERFVRSLQSV